MNWWQKTLVITAFLAVFSFLPGANPASAQTSGALLSRPNQVVVQNDYAYVVSELGDDALEIIDISNPAYPLHKGSITKDENGNKLFFDPKSLDVSGNYAYVANFFANSLEVIDVSDPLSPIPVGKISHGEGGASLIRPAYVQVAGNYAYVAVRGSQNISIIDVSDPSNPVNVANIPRPWYEAPASLFISGNYLYFIVSNVGTPGGAMYIYDISDPSSPQSRGVISHGTDGASIDNPTSVFVIGNYAYVTSFGGRSLEIIDVSNPVLPVHAGTIYDGDGGANLLIPFSVFVEGDYAYVATHLGSALEIIDVSDPTNPLHQGVINDGDGGAVLSYSTSVDVDGNYAYVTSTLGNALEIVDISDPANPVHKGKLLNGEIGPPPPPPARNPVLIVPGVLGTEIFKGSEELWMDLGKIIAPGNDTFLDPLLFGTDLLPDDPNLNLGNVISEKTIDLGLVEFEFNYTERLLKEFEGQGYTENVDLFMFPYDWRYGVNDININAFEQKILDIKTQTGSDEIDVIAHSTGGLLVKKYAMDNPTTNYIGKAVFVGVPNTGAPKAIKALLVGDHFGNPFLSLSEMRKLAKNMPVVYDLAPSRQYYDQKGSYFGIWDQSLFSSTITDLNFDETSDYIVNNNGMNSQAISNAENLHTQIFDNYDLQNAGVDPYSIVGCKAGTIGKVYERKGIFPGYSIVGVPGDGTVPLESATNLPINSSNKYYALEGSHAEMLTQEGTRQQIVNIISGSNLPTNNVTQDVSECELNGKAIEVYSPLSLDIVDQDGNHSGLDEDGNIFNDIPNASFEVLEDHKFAYLPTDEGQTYTISLVGTGDGTFTLTSSDIVANEVTETGTFSNIPVTTSLKGTLDIEDSTLSIDTNGDGQTDQVIEPDSGELTLNELLSLLKEKIQSLNIKDSLRKNLLKKIDKLEKKIAKQKKHIKIPIQLEKKVSKLANKEKISDSEAQEILDLLNQVENMI